MYNVVTGFYPSIETAKKIQKRVCGKGVLCVVRGIRSGYCVVLYDTESIKEAVIKQLEYTKKKICCGVCIEL